MKLIEMKINSPREIFKEINENGRISGLFCERCWFGKKNLVPMKKCRCRDLDGGTSGSPPRHFPRIKENRRILGPF